jgi:hypothetical protein
MTSVQPGTLAARASADNARELTAVLKISWISDITV